MRVQARLFALFREAAGTDRVSMDLPSGATVADLWAELAGRYPPLAPHRPAAAIGTDFASPASPLREGDEVAFLPPVSGG